MKMNYCTFEAECASYSLIEALKPSGNNVTKLTFILRHPASASVREFILSLASKYPCNFAALVRYKVK